MKLRDGCPGRRSPGLRVAQCLADLRGQLPRGERLAQEKHGCVAEAVADRRVVGVATDEEDGEFGAPFEHGLGQFAAAHARHHDIGNQHCHVVAVLVEQRQRLVTVGRGDHRIALTFENQLRDGAHGFFVFGE